MTSNVVRASQLPQITDPQVLRTFIMYDARDRRAIFEGYKHFCKATQNPDFDYVEYEYWYYKFYCGNMDTSDERGLDYKPKNLAELPVEILDRIFKTVDPIDVTRLRRMNKTFNRIANGQTPRYKHVEVFFSETNISWNLEGVAFHHLLENDDHNLQIRLPFPRSKRADLDDLIQKLQQPNLEIEKMNVLGGGNILNNLTNRLEPNSLHVKSLAISNEEKANFLNMLSRAIPGELEKIQVSGFFFNDANVIGPIAETEQWRQAKSLTIEHVGLLDAAEINRCLHFEEFRISVNSLPAQNLIQLRNSIVAAPNFKKCHIAVVGNLNNNWKIRWGTALGAVIPDGRGSDIIHQYPIPNSMNVLEFNISEVSMEITKKRR